MYIYNIYGLGLEFVLEDKDILIEGWR